MPHVVILISQLGCTACTSLCAGRAGEDVWPHIQAHLSAEGSCPSIFSFYPRVCDQYGACLTVLPGSTMNLSERHFMSGPSAGTELAFTASRSVK